MRLLTRKYKYATKYATNLLLGVLCAYSVCACDDVKRITPNDTQSDNERPDSGKYEPNPTDTDQDKPWEQPDENHQETPDNQWEQPDGNHNENPDNQWEQPDENHNENPDNQWEQPDEDHNETPDEQNNEGKCDPGYVWVDFDLQPYLSSYEGFVDKQCVSCKTTPGMVNYLEGNYYCPGGDDLKGKYILDQIELCPEYTYVNADYSDCICSYGVPPPGKTCYDLVHGTKKPLVISPKVNVISNHRKMNNQMLIRSTKIRKTKTR